RQARHRPTHTASIPACEVARSRRGQPIHARACTGPGVAEVFQRVEEGRRGVEICKGFLIRPGTLGREAGGDLVCPAYAGGFSTRVTAAERSSTGMARRSWFGLRSQMVKPSLSSCAGSGRSTHLPWLTNRTTIRVFASAGALIAKSLRADFSGNRCPPVVSMAKTCFFPHTRKSG